MDGAAPAGIVLNPNTNPGTVSSCAGVFFKGAAKAAPWGVVFYYFFGYTKSDSNGLLSSKVTTFFFAVPFVYIHFIQ